MTNNREIKSRGMLTKERVWVYGIYDPYRYRIGSYLRELQTEPFWHYVDHETVGQYTGLKDKNGKEIFEGDIVATPKYGVDNGKGQNYSGKDKFVVGYFDGTYTLENSLRRFCLRPDVDAIVCGNIWDSPELLEVT